MVEHPVVAKSKVINKRTDIKRGSGDKPDVGTKVCNWNRSKNKRVSWQFIAMNSMLSLGTSLEKDLQPFQVLDFEPISEWASELFKQYKKVRELVINHMANSSADRAK